MNNETERSSPRNRKQNLQTNQNMKRKLQIILSAVSVVAFSVMAEDTTKPEAKKPDNSARNERDRDSRTKTPFDQGNSKADVTTTAQIRKEVVGTKDMSVNAQNVKIITNTGKVTLRGPVNTDEEKRLIGEIANKIARAENVDNQLEVTATKISK